MDTALERGLKVLAEVATSPEHTPQSLAEAIDLPVSTTYRYLRQLRDIGYVQEERGRYEPGRALYALTGKHSAQSYIAELAPAILSRLTAELGETSVLVVRVGTRAYCLRRSEPEKAIKYTFATGQLLPLHAGAGQRVLLAWAPPAVIKKVLHAPLPPYTGQTLTRSQLDQSLHRIRQEGWAISYGELDHGAVSVAVPVLFGGDAVCSLDVAGPQERCAQQTWINQALRSLQQAAADLTDALEQWTH